MVYIKKIDIYTQALQDPAADIWQIVNSIPEYSEDEICAEVITRRLRNYKDKLTQQLDAIEEILEETK